MVTMVTILRSPVGGYEDPPNFGEGLVVLGVSDKESVGSNTGKKSPKETGKA
jgi:hypothetical protein